MMLANRRVQLSFLCLNSISGGSGWVDLLSTATLTGMFAIVGILLRMVKGKPTRKHLGNILLGFAVLMYGMTAMSGAGTGQSMWTSF